MHPSITTFITCDYCLEILYAPLVSWDMNSRGAKLKNFGDFCQNLPMGLPQLLAVEQTIPRFSLNNYQNTLQSLSIGYDVIDLMSTQSKLVSNSKCFHFLFPEICSPMDTTNTLKKIYGNTNESKSKYLEISEFIYNVIKQVQNTNQYIDKQWNTCPMKIVDNAILSM